MYFHIALVAALTLGACQSKIGDDCGSSINCSFAGNRICDNTQPDGYCTIRGCEANSCPGEATCVKFRPETERLSSTWCMRKCGGNGDCRGDSNATARYRCVSGEEMGPNVARVIDKKTTQKFCASMPR